MCLGAIYWARPSKLFYACTRADAANIGFDDDFIYKELNLSMEKRSISMVQILQTKGLEVFKNWMKKIDKIKY
jgi:tRNA(Arg) A34 adenosine deaminase TadA